LLLAFLLSVTAAPARAAGWPVTRGPSHEPVPFRYDPAQVKKLPKEFLEDTPACTLYSGTTHLIEADGTVETITHEIIRFNGRKGIEKLGEYNTITYNPSYQKLTLNEARVIKADGKSIPVEPRHVQLRDLNVDYAVYIQDKQLVISFPLLDVGDTIEVKWTARGKNPEYQGQFFTAYTFGDDNYPVARDELFVRLPRARTLKYATVNGKLKPEVRTQGNYRHYHWLVTNRRQLPQDENLPSKEEFRLRVVLSTFTSWAEVGKWKRKLRKDCWECTAKIRKVVVEVTKDLKTPEEKARALTYWVRRHVRYVSLGTASHDYKPLTPAAVFANRFGDCKDQAQLLAVMLKAAGLDVAPVTLCVRGDGQIVPEVPSPWGSHAILLVTIGGKRHWIDSTVARAPWDYLSRDSRDRVVYVVDDKDIRLLRTPALTADDSRTEQTTEITVASGGSSHSRRRAVYRGTDAVAQRETWSEVPAGERRRLVAAALQDSNSRTRLRRLVLSERNLRNPEGPVTAVMEFDIPGHFSGKTELEGSITDSKVWGRLVGINVDYDRQTPLDLGTPFESVHRYVIRLPVALRFDGLPRAKVVRSRWGSFYLAVVDDPKDPRRCGLEFKTRITKTRVAVADFPRFRKFQEEVGRSYRVWLTFKPTQDIADAPYLEALQYLAPQDAAAATVLAQLYCQNDQLADARRVLSWARFLHPNEARLWELSVRAAATLADEEATYRVMVRRFPEERQYVLALGRTRVQRGQYAAARDVLLPLAARGPALLRGAAHYQLARAEFFQGRPQEALRHFEAAAKADADSVAGTAALQFKGQVYEKLKRPRDAAAAYRQALKADADSEGALLALIRLELAAGHRSEVLDHLRRYTVVVKDDLQGLVRAADYHLQLGRLEDAADLARRALDIRHDLRAQRILGLVYARRGPHDKAVATLTRAVQTPDVREALIRGYLALGRLRDAVKQAEAAKTVVKPPSGLSRACTLVSRLRQRREALAKQVRIPADKAEVGGRGLDALVCAELAHERGRPAREVSNLLAPAFGTVAIGPAYSLRGQLFLEGGRLVKALADADKALALGNQDARAYLVRGRVRYERGTAGAVADLKKAAELTRRKDAAVLHALAAALYRDRHQAEALTAQREAVKLRPHDPELLEQLREFERGK
jgi:tetratricopeptide (TPR) repeat protein/transglutaminase-like putative cysteine protease